MNDSRVVRFSLFVLVYNVAVILWGAWVRITGSGAGCGEHWPTCNGEVIPRAESTQTLIEFTHRITSGISLVLVLGMLFWVFRVFPKKHPARLGAAGTTLFILSEALLGAGLVLLGLTGTDSSGLRAIFIVLHLINTFSLTACNVLTAWWAAGNPKPLRKQKQFSLLFWGVLGILVVSMAGAITALGDTLFPVDTNDPRDLFTRLGGDLSTASHFLIRLRAVHPIFAVLVSLYLWLVCSSYREKDGVTSALAWIVSSTVLLQVLAGVINIALAAPGWMQILHLLLSTMLWLSYIVFVASALVEKAQQK